MLQILLCKEEKILRVGNIKKHKLKGDFVLVKENKDDHVVIENKILYQ